MCFTGTCDRCEEVSGLAYFCGYHLCSKCWELSFDECNEKDVEESDG